MISSSVVVVGFVDSACSAAFVGPVGPVGFVIAYLIGGSFREKRCEAEESLQSQGIRFVSGESKRRINIVTKLSPQRDGVFEERRLCAVSRLLFAVKITFHITPEASHLNPPSGKWHLLKRRSP